MPYYRALFKLPGGRELEAHKGYVPDIFFDAIQKVTVNDIVDTYEDGFVLSTDLHEKLNIHDTYTSYAAIGKNAPVGTNTSTEFKTELLNLLKNANHARPLENHHGYQVFYMEYIETPPDDD
ncbi:hypothetical protein GR160_13355 [Flavobacterium sp. Sd200]|uniref:hypothetical protein n=1 Tax=Flavobacterium sp. Sd200 TaxID=2692211 RepID=UPI00136B9F2F|nr:hypothetical protein [Flavobacterium sp. Sd200]MXN92212.1 hypothetical protein [Flavobacterium sp. Sd200]